MRSGWTREGGNVSDIVRNLSIRGELNAEGRGTVTIVACPALLRFFADCLNTLGPGQGVVLGPVSDLKLIFAYPREGEDELPTQ
jgi:hypothetical protein